MEKSMYNSISEVLQDVAAGRITPEQGDLEIELLNAAKEAPAATDAQGIPFEHTENVQNEDHTQKAEPKGGTRGSVAGIWGGDIDFNVEHGISGIIGGCIRDKVHIGGSVSGPIGGGIGSGVHIDGGISGPIGGSIGNYVQVGNGISGPIGGSIGRDTVIGGNLSGAVGGNIERGTVINGNISGVVGGIMAAHVHGSVSGAIGGDLNGIVDGSVSGVIGGSLNGEVAGDVGSPHHKNRKVIKKHLRGKVGGSVYGKIMGDVSGTVEGNVTYIHGNIIEGAVIKGRVDHLRGENRGTVLGGIVKQH